MKIQSQIGLIVNFKKKSHLQAALTNKVVASKILCQVRGGNSQLGNWYKNQYGFKYEFCPHCEIFRFHIKLTESHVIFECPAVSTVRWELNISNYLATQKAQ